jgi:hypothetical protein
LARRAGQKALAWAARTSIGQDEMLRVSFTHNLWGDAAEELAIQERDRQGCIPPKK